MKQISLTYCGMYGEGPTVKEAKQDAARKIEKVLSGEWSPKIISHCGLYSIVYRSPMGWFYSSPRSFNETTECTMGSFETVEEAERSARRHMGQNLWSPADGLRVPGCVVHPVDIQFLTSWCKWQLAYKSATEAGASNEEARNMASGF